MMYATSRRAMTRTMNFCYCEVFGDDCCFQLNGDDCGPRVLFWTKNSGRRIGELKNGAGEASIVGAAKREPDRFRFVDMVELG